MSKQNALEALNEVEKKQIELMDIKNIMSLWHPNLIVLFGTVLDYIKIVRTALALLCSLAEKGERYEKAVVRVRARLAKTYSIVCETEQQKAIASAVDAALEDVISEAERE